MSAAVSAPVARERPILFSGAMVRAILAGEKTQTRRLVKLPPAPNDLGVWEPTTIGDDGVVDGRGRPVAETPGIWHARTGALLGCPYGGPGDRLWVRETHGRVTGNGIRTVYRADGEEPKELLTDRRIPGMKWTPSIFMRRHQSRITLAVVGVRVERLQAITDEDVRAEGVDHAAASELVGKPVPEGTPLQELWRMGWDAINGKRAPYAADPFVWVVSFKRIAEIGASS